MKFLRFYILFAFSAFSIAKAACNDFEIFANQVSLGCNSTLNIDAIYGNPLILSISPTDGNIKWTSSNIVLGTEPEYTPIPENKDQTVTYIVERNGVPKRINVSFYQSFLVSFDTDGGEPSIPSQRVRRGFSPKQPTETLTKAGYTFDGWNLENSFGLTYITKDITIKAKWIVENYTIRYFPNGGTMIPDSPPTSYNIESKPIALPNFAERCGYKFEGWFDNPTSSGTPITMLPTGSMGNKNFYAKWTNIPDTPKVNMLTYSQPSASNKTYDGRPATPVTVSKTVCPMGAITILYNDSKIEPKNAGIYQVYASIEANNIYTAANVLLGNLTISKANATFNVSATVNDKEYDGTTAATIKNIAFTPTSALYGTDEITESDYSATANFSNPNVGTYSVDLSVTWLDGLLSQNYNIDIGTTAQISATITRSKSAILKIEAKDYELFSPDPHEITIYKSSYINDSDVRIEYKREGEANFVAMQKPNKVGNWSVRAIVDGNANYEGKTAEANFVVTRGNTVTIAGFNLDSALSDKQRKYYVAGAGLCEIKDTKINIILEDPDVTLMYENFPQKGELDESGFVQYEIPYTFVKPPGLDTLFYKLLSKDNSVESDTILIETHIPFGNIVMRKWDNVLFVNNNPKTNGGYDIKDFKWFKNNVEISDAQFYSAGPKSTDILNSNDIYKVVMQTAKGIRISTCEDNASNAKIKVLDQVLKPKKVIQVLGIKEKSLNPGSKIYNLKGKLTKETPAGVYIVEE